MDYIHKIGGIKMFTTVRSANIRFTNFIMKSINSIGIIEGDLAYEISPQETLEELF